MAYYVVNTGRGRSTHIMQSKTPSTPGMVSDQVANFIWFGSTIKHALCGLQATRYVNVFSPAEASCRECRRRWQLAVAAEAAKTPEDRTREAAARSSQRAAQVLIIIGVAILTIVLMATHVIR